MSVDLADHPSPFGKKLVLVSGEKQGRNYYYTDKLKNQRDSELLLWQLEATDNMWG